MANSRVIEKLFLSKVGVIKRRKKGRKKTPFCQKSCLSKAMLSNIRFIKKSFYQEAALTNWRSIKQPSIKSRFLSKRRFTKK